MLGICSHALAAIPKDLVAFSESFYVLSDCFNFSTSLADGLPWHRPFFGARAGVTEAKRDRRSHISAGSKTHAERKDVPPIFSRYG